MINAICLTITSFNSLLTSKKFRMDSNTTIILESNSLVRIEESGEFMHFNYVEGQEQIDFERIEQ